MRCLKCGKEIIHPKQAEMLSGWHEGCIRNFFGTSAMPEVTLNEKSLMKIAVAGVSRGDTVPGVQKKISLAIEKSRSESPRLTVMDYPAGYILKPQASQFRCLPEAEHMVMLMAEKTGLSVVPHALIKDSEGAYAYITRRIDRRDNNLFAMEDFCQLGERLTQDKYKGSYEKCGKTLEKYSSRPMLDKAEFFLRLVFCFATGNSDMHLKNFSLIETVPGGREYILSPAYDMLPVNLVMPEDTEEMALSLNGKKSRLKRRDFESLGERLDLAEKAVSKMIDKVISLEKIYVSECKNAFMPDDMKNEMITLMEKRIRILEGK